MRDEERRKEEKEERGGREREGRRFSVGASVVRPSPATRHDEKARPVRVARRSVLMRTPQKRRDSSPPWSGGGVMSATRAKNATYEPWQHRSRDRRRRCRRRRRPRRASSTSTIHTQWHCATRNTSEVRNIRYVRVRILDTPYCSLLFFCALSGPAGFFRGCRAAEASGNVRLLIDRPQDKL